MTDEMKSGWDEKYLRMSLPFDVKIILKTILYLLNHLRILANKICIDCFIYTVVQADSVKNTSQ